MTKTKQEVRDWLNSKVGTTVRDKSNSALDGQCVALIKGLMEFLGVNDPYAARGNAKDAGDTYIRQGIGTPGRGWLTICVNRNMGLGYGHIWVDLQDEFNFEQNGARALSTTKNTRPITQAQQFVNFDKWIGEDMTPEFVKLAYWNVKAVDADKDTIKYHVDNTTPEQLMQLLKDNKEVAWVNIAAERDALTNQIQDLKKQLAEKPVASDKGLVQDVRDIKRLVTEIRSIFK